MESAEEVVYEESQENCLSNSCILHRCRDLYNLALTSLDLFHSVINSFENTQRLRGSIVDVLRRMEENNSCPWIMVMIYAGAHSSTIALLEELAVAFSLSKKLPVGLSLRNNRGRANLTMDEYDALVVVSKQATRLCLACIDSSPDPFLSTEPLVWSFLWTSLKNEDICQNALATSALLRHLSSREEVSPEEVETVIGCLCDTLKDFEDKYMTLQEYERNKQIGLKDLGKARRKFKHLLKKVAKTDDEENLDVPLEYYLKEDDDLRRAHEVRRKAQVHVEQLQKSILSIQETLEVRFATVRALAVATAALLLLCLGVYVENILHVYETPVPRCRDDNQHHRFIPTTDVLTTCKNYLEDIPWDVLFTFGLIEKKICKVVVVRLLAAAVHRCYSDWSQTLSNWTRQCLLELSEQQVRWYPIEETPPPVINNVAPRYLRELSLCARIDSILAYWYTRGNCQLDHIAHWIGERNAQTPLWLQLLNIADSKSDYVFDVEAYFAKHNPAKVFRQMSLHQDVSEQSVFNALAVNSDQSSSDSDIDEDEDDISPLDNMLANDEFLEFMLKSGAQSEDGYQNMNLLKQANMICCRNTFCAVYIHDELFVHVNKVLSRCLEGTGDIASFRYIHPWHVIATILSQDTSGYYVSTLRQYNNLSEILSSKRFSVRCDMVFRSAYFEICSYVLVSAQPSYQYPSLTADHSYALKYSTPAPASVDTYGALLEYLDVALTMAAEEVYECDSNMLCSFGPVGRSVLSYSLKFLSAVAHIDAATIRNQLENMWEKKSLSCVWESGDVPDEYVWITPFIEVWAEGVDGLIGHYQGSTIWQDVAMTSDWCTSVRRCDILTRRHFSELFSVLCVRDAALCHAVASSTHICGAAMLTSLALRDTQLSQYLLRIASSIISQGKRRTTQFAKTKAIPFQSPTNFFRIGFALEGNSLEIACDMIASHVRDAYYFVFAVMNMTPPNTARLIATSREPDEINDTLDVGELWTNIYNVHVQRRARDFLFCALEYLVEMCDGRLELQDKICSTSPHLFSALPLLLTTAVPIVPPEVRVGYISHNCYDRDRSLAGAAALTIKILSHRHLPVRKLVKNNGCVVGLINALSLSYSTNDKYLGMQVVQTVEQLMIRNIDAWKYIRRTAGMRGMLQLCHMGNDSIRVLSSTEILKQIDDSGEAFDIIIKEVLDCDGLKIVLELMHSDNTKVQSCALSLLTAMLKLEECRLLIMTDAFILEIALLLYSVELHVVRTACNVLLLLGSYNQSMLRGIIWRMPEVLTADEGNDIIGVNITPVTDRLIDIANGRMSQVSISKETLTTPQEFFANSERWTDYALPTTYESDLLTKRDYEEPRLVQEVMSLAHAAAAVLASLTDSEESVWPDGGPPLKQTLLTSGVLPMIC